MGVGLNFIFFWLCQIIGAGGHFNFFLNLLVSQNVGAGGDLILSQNVIVWVEIYFVLFLIAKC